MKLLLRGHDDRYAVEQLQLALFPEEPMEPVTEPFSGDGAVSSLHTGAVWLTATAEITLHGKTGRACRRLRTAEADVPARRRLLQNTYYEAAMCLREPPAWGSLSGVRPTKLTTRALLEGRTPAEAEKLLRTRYHVSPERSRLCVEASEATVRAAQLLRPQDVSVYVGIPFCPTRCAYCSFVSSSIERFPACLSRISTRWCARSPTRATCCARPAGQSARCISAAARPRRSRRPSCAGSWRRCGHILT